MNERLTDPDRVVLHVGVPKTGTTTLQFNVFPRLEGVVYLGKPYDRPGVAWEANSAVAGLVEAVWTRTDAEFDHQAAGGLLARGLEGRQGLGEAVRVVLSEEALTQASGGDRLEKARRLRRVFGRCRVLITIREQRDALFSGHRWLSARRMVDRSFVGWINGCRAYSHVLGRADDFPLRQYRYGELIRTYRRMFGEGRVTVIPMELLKNDPAAFAAALAPVLGAEAGAVESLLASGSAENVSPGVLGVEYQRFARRVRAWKARNRPGWVDPMALSILREGVHERAMNAIERVDFKPRPPRGRVAAWLADYYRSSNRIASELSGWRLDEMGYAT